MVNRRRVDKRGPRGKPDPEPYKLRWGEGRMVITHKSDSAK